MRRSVGPILALAIAAATSPALAQTNCGQAVTQLQSYAQQVNAVAQQAYYQGIPMQCGWNQQCQYMMLSELNAWYEQQAQLVNSWYMQIQQQCNRQQAPPPVRSRARRNAPPEMDENRLSELEVDKEDRTVRIRIPSTPQGYR